MSCNSRSRLNSPMPQAPASTTTTRPSICSPESSRKPVESGWMNSSVPMSLLVWASENSNGLEIRLEILTTADGLALVRLMYFFVGESPAPRCGITPPPEESIWFKGGDYCEWMTNRGRVGTQRDQQRRVRAVILNRETKTEANARAIVDSIGSTLQSWGLRHTGCASGSTPAGEVRSWLYARRDIVVYVSETTPPSAPPGVLALAVDDPNAFPLVLCHPVPDTH